MLRKQYWGLILMVLTLGFFPAYLLYEQVFLQPTARDRLHEENTERGLEVFAEFCVLCHGDRGQGGIGLPLDTPDLRGQDDIDIFNTIARGRSGTAMPSWLKEEGGALDRQQIQGLVAFIKDGTRWDEVVDHIPLEAITPTPAGPPDGATVFAGTCAACHGPDAEGAIGPRLRDNAFVQSESDDEMVAFDLGGRPQLAMPAWEGILSEEEIRAVVEFLRSLQPAS
ncbi:MAG: c-type cytochrome [Anaerolineae bacterium]